MSTIENSAIDNFRANLKDRLDRQGYGSKSRLARHLDCSPAMISQLISGAKRPSLEMVERIADYFDVRPASMIKRPA